MLRQFGYSYCEADPVGETTSNTGGHMAATGSVRDCAAPAVASERMLLAGLGVFTAMSVIGFAVYGLHPERLAGLPASSLAFYSVAFRFFAVGQVWLATGVIGWMLWRRTRTRWLPAFGALYLISLGSELLGTTRGIPFGHYSYSELLAPMWAAHVPIIIPLSWFYMAIPSYAFAIAALPGEGRGAGRIALGSFVLLTWDLALDPAMSFATRYWVWEGTGPYYGMPWLNLFGWYVTGLLLMAALVGLRAERWVAALPGRWLAGFYGANLFLAVGMCLAAGLGVAVAATLATLLLTVTAAWYARRRAVSAVTRSDPITIASAVEAR